MASGRPVIAYAKGGVTETIILRKTGVFFYEQTWESLLDTVLKFDPLAWDGEQIRAHALQFSKAAFQEKVKKFVEEKYEGFVKT